MTTLTTFSIGALGALAPEIVRLYALRTKASEFSWSPFYFLMSASLALLGGVVAVILPAMNDWAAFYAGISTPVLVNFAAERVTADRGDGQLKGAKRGRSLLRSFIDAL